MKVPISWLSCCYCCCYHGWCQWCFNYYVDFQSFCHCNKTPTPTATKINVLAVATETITSVHLRALRNNYVGDRFLLAGNSIPRASDRIVAIDHQLNDK